MRESWHPTLELERFGYLTLGMRESWHPTLSIKEPQYLKLSLGKFWKQPWSKGSTFFYSCLIFLMFLQIHLPGVSHMINTTTRCLVWMNALAFLHTLWCLLSIIAPGCLRAFWYLMWIANSRLKLSSISKFLHAAWIHERRTSMLHTGSSSWGGFIAVAFYFNKLQLSKPKDSWKTICCSILQLLEGKQFKRGGFAKSPFTNCN